MFKSIKKKEIKKLIEKIFYNLTKVLNFNLMHYRLKVKCIETLIKKKQILIFFLFRKEGYFIYCYFLKKNRYIKYLKSICFCVT